MRIAGQGFQILFVIILLSLSNIKGQFKIKANAETGYFTSNGTSIISQSDFLNSIDSQFGYTYKDEMRSAEIKFRVRPEFYGLDNPLRTLKFGADGSYDQSEDSFNWGFELSRQLYNFRGRNIDLAYDSFNILAKGVLFPLETNPIGGTAGYGYQKINNSITQDLEYYFVNFTSSITLSESSKLGYGVYIENFSVSNETPSLPGQISSFLTENEGWRFGPQVGFYYLKEAVLNIDYRFLVHNSGLTNNLSNEQWLRVVTGKLITDKWSIFLLVDLYLRNLKLNAAGEKNLSLLYNSLNIDNRIYLKTGYELSDHFEVYIRTGYFKENLVANKYSYSGWNTLLGVEVGN